MRDPLKAATAAVGLLAGIVAGVYLLGGLVLGLRLLFDQFDFSSVVAILGQLPRELVVATAMVYVVTPAVIFGLLVALVCGGLGLPRRHRGPVALRGAKTFVGLAALAALFGVPTAYEVWHHEGSQWLLRALVCAVLTVPVVFACWYELRLLSRRRRSRLYRALLAGALFAAMALLPLLSLSSAVPFENAQLCLPHLTTPIQGQLVGEGTKRILLEENFGGEASLRALPVDAVTLSEYGDLSSLFACPLSPGEKEEAKVAEANLDGHGSETEVKLATALRPRLRFDRNERWRPLAVRPFVEELFLDGRGHEVCPPLLARECRPLHSLAQLEDPQAHGYIDIHGSSRNGADYASPNPACRTSGSGVDCNAGPTSAIYYRRTTHEGRWYWDYWWFLRYNDWKNVLDPCNKVICSDHEGDWEGITVITTPTEHPEIVGAIYAAHKDRIYVRGPELPKAGNHPVVFVAEGTHASYPFRCAAGCEQYARPLPEDEHDGSVPWGGNSGAECLRFRCVRPLPEVGKPGQLALPLAGGWAGWLGHWGKDCANGCASALDQGSPSSPGTQTRFQCPWVPTKIARPAPDDSGLSHSEAAGDAQRLLAVCAAQRGGL